MFKRLWLSFAQAVTVLLAVLFVLAAFRPQWLPNRMQANPSSAPVTNLSSNSKSALSNTNADTGPRINQNAVLSYSEAAKRAIPAVVNIVTSKQSKLPPNHPLLNDPLFKKFFGDQLGDEGSKGGRNGQRPNASLGSGVISRADGIVLTNYHVVEAANDIEVVLADGRKVPAKLLGGDPETDLAVLKIEMNDLPTMAFANVENAKIGDVVLAIGNPFGVGQTVTMGIVSALGRSQLGINTFENFIQTDAAINPGNSGGALVDSNGNLLGINTAIYSRSGGSLGIGFAIPATTVRQVMDSVLKTGTVRWGYIGVEPQDITPELAEAFKLPRSEGAMIAGVVQKGPADTAGIRPGDILIAVEGKPVNNVSGMLNLIAQLEPGTPAKLTFIRNTKEETLSITVGTRPKPAQSRRPE